MITFVARCARISVWQLKLDQEPVGRTGLYGFGGGLFPDSLVIETEPAEHYFTWRELDPGSGWGVHNSGWLLTDSVGVLRVVVDCVAEIPPRPVSVACLSNRLLDLDCWWYRRDV